MGRKHLTDKEIQTFLDSKRSDQEMERNHHLKNCEICQRNLKYYQNLYVGLEKEPGFKLPGNFAKIVVSKLPNKQAVPFLSPSVEIALIITGIILALGTTFYFIDLKPLSGIIGRIALPKMAVNTSFLQPIKNLLADLNGSLILVPFAALALIAVALFDRIIHKVKHHKLSL